MIMAAVPGQKLVHCNKKYKNTGHQGMPQRHHQDINAHRNSWRSSSNVVCRWCSLAAACFALPLTPKSIISTPLCWKPQKVVCKQPICRVFQKICTTTRTYQVDIWLNKRRFHRKKLHLPPMQSNFCSHSLR